MQIATEPRQDAKQSVTRKDILSLAAFCDQEANAVSFYFGRASVPDKAHHEEVLAIKKLLHDATSDLVSGRPKGGLASDLEEILALEKDIRANPARLRCVFASHDHQVWYEFDLPVAATLDFLKVGRHFQLAPFMRALQSTATYSVAIMESGKARAFIVSGTRIWEFPKQLTPADLHLHAQNSRVGWSSHIEGNKAEYEQAYFKKLSHELKEFMGAHGANVLVVGCRDDLWGEVAPQFADIHGSLAGRFHLPTFDVSPAEVLLSASTIVAGNRTPFITSVLQEINETPGRSAFGVKNVLKALMSGRVHKVVLGNLGDEVVIECKGCGRIMAVDGGSCSFCGKTEVVLGPAEEGIIREALFTGAEILFAEPASELEGAAALLRY